MNWDFIHSLLVGVLLLLSVLLGIFEVFATWGMGRPAQIALVILLIAATLWISEIVPLFVTSFVVLILSTTWLQDAMRQSNMPVTQTAFLSPFFSNIILLFLGAFVLSAAFHKYRLDERLA